MKFLKYYIPVIVLIIIFSSFLSAQTAPLVTLPLSEESEESKEHNYSDIIKKAESLLTNAKTTKNPFLLLCCPDCLKDNNIAEIINSVNNGNDLSRKINLLKSIDNIPNKSLKEQVLLNSVNDISYAIRDLSLYICGLNQDPILLEKARTLIDDEDYYIRARAAWYLAKLKDRQSLNKIESKIASETPYTALRFAQSAFILGSVNAGSYLKSKSIDPKNTKIRAYALFMLLESGDISVIDSLLNLTNNFDDRAADIAFEALSKYSPDNRKDVFAQTLAKGNINCAKKILERLKKSDNAVPIINMAINLSEKKRFSFFSGVISKTKSEESYINALKDDSLKELIPQALEVTEKLDNETALNVSREILKNINKKAKNNDEIIEKAIDIISKSGSEADIELLAKYMDFNENISIKASCVIYKISSNL